MNQRGTVHKPGAYATALVLRVGLTLSILLAGCVSPGPAADETALEEPGPLEEDPPEPTEPPCTDKDGDGFGPGCDMGVDCDDSDPLVRDECYACNQNQSGCPCSREGQRFACGELVTDAEGNSACRMGERVCEGGRWSECRPSKDWQTAMQPLGLGSSATECQNTPCDPYCQHYVDKPDPSLTDLDAGIVGTDSGIEIAPVEIDAGPPHDCVNETAEAQPVPLDVYIMLDKSGSMSGTRWNAVISALKTFVQDSSSAGITVALDYFPESSSCTVAQYASPSVNWSLLPGGAQAIVNSLNGASPNGSNTPTLPALQGAIQAAQARQAAYPDHKVIVVLATDGDPNGCSSSITSVRNAATDGLNGSPSIQTYVIGVGSVSNLNQIAAAGGTTSAYITDSGNAASFLAAMQTIRNQAIGCEYRLPLPSTGNLDPAATVVSYRYGTGASTVLTRRNSASACGTNHGFYYDNNTLPTKLFLCPATCSTVGSNVNYKVDLTFKCKTSCGSTSTSVEPLTLDMYVMLDRSGSMSGTRWTAVTSALKTFVQDPTSSGVTVALDYFPESTSCSTAQYATPSVNWSMLPGAASAFVNSLNGTSPNGSNTPTLPALQGALQAAQERQIAYPQHKVVVVLATDGDPNGCSSTISSVSQAAAAAYQGTTTNEWTVTQVNDPYQSITSTGTQVITGSDDASAGGYDIGFNFNFYGQSYNRFWVDSNGYITFTSDGHSRWTNMGLPSAAAPSPMIAPFWDDLTAGSVHYRREGSAPNRRLIVQWSNYRGYGRSSNLNFQLVLHENGDTVFRYGSMTGDDANGASANIGLNSVGGSNGYNYPGAISSNMSLRFGPSQTLVDSSSYEDISSTGTLIINGGDDTYAGGYNIGFNFAFYGQVYTQFWADSNGYLTFTSAGHSVYRNGAVPSSSSPNPMIAPFWDDLYGGQVYYKRQGSAPNRQLIVQWSNWEAWSRDSNFNFQVVLHENGDVVFRYGSMTGDDSTGSSATIGFNSAGGSSGYAYSESIYTGLATRFRHQSVTTVSIPTYVVGVGSVANLNTIAAAGGTGTAYITDSGNASSFLEAMRAIRQSALGCQYAIPPATVQYGVVDPNRLTVRYTPNGTETPVDLPLRSGASACGSSQGFYYNNPTNPTTLILCPASCNTVSADQKAKLAIFYDCLPTHEDGVFTRDYSAVGLCPPGSSHLWSTFSWNADTPGSTFIDFTVAVANTAAGLATAPEYQLQFTNPPTTGTNVGRPLKAQSAVAPATNTGWARVDPTLSVLGLDRKAPYLRLRAKLNGQPPAFIETPVLRAWDVSISCEASE